MNSEDRVWSQNLGHDSQKVYESSYVIEIITITEIFFSIKLEKYSSKSKIFIAITKY